MHILVEKNLENTFYILLEIKKNKNWMIFRCKVKKKTLFQASLQENRQQNKCLTLTVRIRAGERDANDNWEKRLRFWCTDISLTLFALVFAQQRDKKYLSKNFSLRRILKESTFNNIWLIPLAIWRVMFERKINE